MWDILLDGALAVLTFLGITVLILLGVVVLILLLVLFVPIRYNGEIVKNAEITRVRLNIGWLLKLVRTRIVYENELGFKIFVFLFKVYDSSKTKKTHSGRMPKSKDVKTQKQADAKEESAETSKKEERINFEQIDFDKVDLAEINSKKSESKNSDNEAEPVNSEENSGENTGEDVKTRQKPKITVRVRNLIEKIKNIVANIICKIKSICDKIKFIVQNINYYVEIISAEETKIVFGRVVNRIFKVLKSICPRKLKADILVGTGAPDTTGYLMAAAGMLYPCIGNKVNITPDFDNTVFEGEIYLKGHIRVIVLLIQALKIYLDKDLRDLISKLKREDA